MSKCKRKRKKSFWTKVSFLSFCQKSFLAIFRLFGPLKALLIFLPNDYFFLQMGFLSIKSTFKPPKRNPKQALRLDNMA
jgi:hypothetical protein